MGKSRLLLLLAAAVGALLIGLLCLEPCRNAFIGGYRLLTDREQLKPFLASLGMAAPLVFILVQILQVVFAPFPGEISGFIGGYFFGVFPGFLLSSIGLTVGSWINFSIGRFMGERYIRDKIASRHLERLDTLVRRQGMIVIFFLFVFPGFPKDYLCLFLGVSHLPARVFMLMAAVGRMPGTLMLSLQGAALFEEMYFLLAVTLALCLVAAFLAHRYRQSLYRWVAQMNRH